MNEDAKLIKLRVSNENCWFLDVDQTEIDGIVYHALIKCDENGVPDEDRRMMVEKERVNGLGEIELVPVEDSKEFNDALDAMIARQGVDAIRNIVDESGCFDMEDENGNPIKFELIDSMEHNGVIYHAVIPVDDEDSFVVLKQSINEDGLSLGSVDDDGEYEEIGNLFLERFADEDESYDEDE